LRGNHECRVPNSRDGFLQECNRYFPKSKVWSKFNSCFDWMPLSAVVGGRILCVHGGLSPKLTKLDQLKRIERPDSGDSGLACDIIWSDPAAEVRLWQQSDRGLGWLFGFRAVETFLAVNSLAMIVRAHEAVEGGYEFPYFPRREVVTLFSAPKYCGEWNNTAAVMCIDSTMNAVFTTFDSAMSSESM
jgi:serine/threonine-protein phosphatase PP1 catalytic subunit